MQILDRELFIELAQDNIEQILIKNGFEDLEFIRRDQDGENDIIFVYSGLEVEFNKRWGISTHVNFENYKENFDFSTIELIGYLVGNGGDVFFETGNIIKEEYLKLKSYNEKNHILQSLDNQLLSINQKKRI